MIRVCVVGSLHYDVMVRAPYLPRAGETLIGQAWWWKPGGKGGNQAMAAARHGAEVAMVGRLGDDGFGERLRERLVAAGVNVAHVCGGGVGTGMSVAIEVEDGDYAAVVVSGANREIDEAQVRDSGEAIRGGRVVVLQNEIAEAANAEAARLARASGVRVILNAAPARPLGDMAGLVDLLVVNSVEGEMLAAGPGTGLGAGPGAAIIDLESATMAARGLLGLAPVVIVTVGEAGVAAATETGTVAIPGYPVEVAQAHGAGDVFVGALAARLAEEAPLENAIRYANAAAALHVGSGEADRDVMGPDDVRRLLARGRARDLP